MKNKTLFLATFFTLFSLQAANGFDRSLDLDKYTYCEWTNHGDFPHKRCLFYQDVPVAMILYSIDQTKNRVSVELVGAQASHKAAIHTLFSGREVGFCSFPYFCKNDDSFSKLKMNKELHFHKIKKKLDGTLCD